MFDPRTAPAVRSALIQAYRSKQRVRLFTGDTMTGRAWAEEFDVLGTVGRSMGPKHIPLLIQRANSWGGGAVLDHCIVAIATEPGRFLYQHPLFHTGIWTVEPPHTPGYAVAVHHNGQPHAQFRRADQAAPYIAFMRGERFSKAPPRKAQEPIARAA